MIIFIGFNDTDEDDDVPGWPHNEIPDWAKGDDNSLFNLDEDDIGNMDNLSLFYDEMSLGLFNVTATVYPDQVMIDENASYITMGNSVVAWLNANDSDYNWGQFDKRTNKSNWITDNSTSSPDHKIDYTIFAFRNNILSYGYGGFSGISGTNMDLITNYSGTTETYTITPEGHTSKESGHWDLAFKQFFAHEFAHNLFDSPHVNNTQGVVGKHLYTQYGWAMMSSGFRVCYSANAWEKWYLGWIPIEANSVNADIADISDLSATNGIYTLRDFTETGDAIRVKIPFVENQFLWLENHTGNTIYDSREYPPTLPCGGDLDPAPTGLLMFKENMAPNHTTVAVFNSGCNGMDVINAEGNFDYTKSSSEISSSGWCGNIWAITTALANPYGVQSNHTALRFDYDNDATIDVDENTNDPDAQEQDDIHRLNGVDVLGGVLSNASFATGAKIGLGYNPPVSHLQSYDKNDDIPSDAKLDGIYLNGVSVEVLSYAGNGDVTVKIRFDDFDIVQDTRWCGELFLSDNTYTTFPNDYSANVMPYKTLTIDKSGTVNTHLSGIYSDFIRPTTLTCLPGSYLHLEANSNMIIKNGSTVTMQSGSRLEVHENATLTIENGSTLIIEDDAILYIWHDGLVHVKPGGTLIVRNSTADKGIWLDYPQYNVYTAELKVEGTLSFQDGADFLYQGTGFYHFAGTPVLNLSTGSDVVWIGTGQGNKMVELNNSVVLNIDGHPTTIKTGTVLYHDNARLEIENTSLDVFEANFDGTTSTPVGTTGIYGNQLITKCDIKYFNFTDLATGIELRYLDDPLQVNIENGKFENVTTAISGYHVDKMIMLTCSAEDPTVAGSRGLSLASCKYVKLDESSSIKAYDIGAYLVNVKALYLDHSSTIVNAATGIYSTDSKVFMRRGSTIDQSVSVAAEMYGTWNSTTNNYSSMLTMGDKGCAGIIRSIGQGVIGTNTVLSIDAVTHDQNDDNNGYFDHVWFVRAIDNNEKLFDICYTQTASPVTLIRARRNLWCPAGAASNPAPAASAFSFINTAACSPPGSPSVTFDRTPLSVCIPATYNCSTCDETLKVGEGTSEDGTVTVAAIVTDAFSEAYADFIVTDDDATRAAFTDLSVLTANYDASIGQWSVTTLAGVVLPAPDSIVNLIMVAKILQEEPDSGVEKIATGANDIFAEYYWELLHGSTDKIPLFTVYPNPAEDKINVELKDFSGIVKITLVDLSGRMIYSEIIDGQQLSIDLSNIPGGLYLVKGERKDGGVSEVQTIAVQ